ncbi:MAG: DUF2147 domain-containing protein [Phenylobacterium sp.]|uniref:DUF2147 domain-containing protein n=1 Tax=Phenylobacterium sp. TaxID=1871053 RepID=UPI001A5FC4AF|nr:DUF2147 domain-containing protein [Phenylobacterium sp.]MBL8553738.1 DUF2147 domain-containing protein [Phenylobacterium sp.]
MRAIAIAAAFTLAAAPALAADPVEGEWLTQSGSGKVRIAPCGARLCGAITWLKNPADAKATDANNPDARLKARPILGLPMLWGFRQAAQGKWNGGKIYDPASGKTYDSKMSINANGTLKVEGCILMVCQAQTWKRS